MAEMSNVWVRDELTRAGRTQKDLAKAWGVSEASVSRWVEGTQNQDLPASRIWILGQMIGMPCEELIRRLGLAGDAARLPPPAPRPPSDIPLNTERFERVNGSVRVLLHLDLSAKTAAQLMGLLDQAVKEG